MRNSVGRMAYFFFIIDLFLTMLFVVGIYFHLDSIQRINYITQGHMLIIACFTLFFGFVGFAISTAIKVKRTHYQPLYGIALTVVLSAISLRIISSIWTKNQIRTIEMLLLFLPIALFFIYFCVNSFLLVNYRAEMVKERQWIPFFYGYFFDPFFYFWRDLFLNISFEMKKEAKRGKKR